MHGSECAPVVAATEAPDQSDTPYVFQKSWETLKAEAYETHAYSVKAWETQRRAKSSGGVNPLEPQEPAYLGPDVRLAALMCDIQRNRYYANSHIEIEELRSRAARMGVGPTPAEKQAAVAAYVSDRWGELGSTAGVNSVEGAFLLAELTGAERAVMALVLDGRDQSQVAEATGKAIGTVKVLRARATHKLRALAEEVA